MNSEVKRTYTGFKELDLRQIHLNSKELPSLIMAVAPLAQTRLPDGGQAWFEGALIYGICLRHLISKTAYSTEVTGGQGGLESDNLGGYGKTIPIVIVCTIIAGKK